MQTWFNPDLKPRNALIPGLISMVLGFPALSVALALAHEREHGTLEQLLATPVGRAELLLGKIMPYVLVGLINVVAIPLLSIAWFHISFNGNFPLFFGLSAVFMFSVLSMGMVVGVFMRTQAAALALSFLVLFFPGFFLTGIFFPLVSMPEEVRLESLFLPGTHYAIITRGIFLPGVGLDVLWPYAVMMFGAGDRLYRSGHVVLSKKVRVSHAEYESGSLVIKEFIHLRNDWWLPAFMLIGGAMELLLVAWATSRPITQSALDGLRPKPDRREPLICRGAGKHRDFQRAGTGQ